MTDRRHLESSDFSIWGGLVSLLGGTKVDRTCRRSDYQHFRFLRFHSLLGVASLLSSLWTTGCVLYDPWQVWQFGADYNTYRRCSAHVTVYEHLPPSATRVRLYRWAYNVGVAPVWSADENTGGERLQVPQSEASGVPGPLLPPPPVPAPNDSASQQPAPFPVGSPSVAVTSSSATTSALPSWHVPRTVAWLFASP
ncbi:MAG: hypothetical protein KatS3mg114_1043 [Planctomycetaceae bacterium]|nr:MAG: hypothetical protein KatS3mg114_1043 [Planctomycetaceae bacterium]